MVRARHSPRLSTRFSILDSILIGGFIAISVGVAGVVHKR